MRIKLTLLIPVFVFLFFLSCEERIEIQSESVYKPAVIAFLDELNLSNQENAASINALKTTINFKNIASYQLNSSQQILIADITKSGTITDASALKAVFMTDQQKVISGNIVAIDNSSSYTDYNGLIAGFILRKPNQFTGKVNVYNLYERLAFLNVYDNGRIAAHGNVGSGKPKSNNDSKTEVCIDWYLVTTYYYAGGGSSSTSEYLYTSCDCESNTTRTSATMCGGGGGSGGTLPSNATNGDRVFMSFPDGRTAIYRAEVTENVTHWVIVAVTLPSVVITASTNNEYNFLPTYPYHLQSVAGADGLTYEFNGDWGLWQGYLDDYIEINRRFGFEFVYKYRTPLNIPTSGLSDQQIIDQINSKMANLDVENRLLNDTDNRYYLRPVQYTVSVGNPPTSTTTVNVVDPVQWTLDPIFANPGSLTSPANSAAIPLFAESGNVIYITVYFQKTLLF